jgi:TolA-binding protein
VRVDVNSILLGVLLVLASAFCAVGIWALLEGVKTARSAKTLSDDMDARLVPLLDKADVSVDALNAELLRVDTILSRVEEVTDRVESTSRTVQDVANAPGEIVTDIAERVRRAWKRRQAESATSSDARRTEASAATEADEGRESAESPEAPEPPVWPTTIADPPATPATGTGPTAADTTPV